MLKKARKRLRTSKNLKRKLARKLVPVRINDPQLVSISCCDSQSNTILSIDIREYERDLLPEGYAFSGERPEYIMVPASFSIAWVRATGSLDEKAETPPIEAEEGTGIIKTEGEG